MGYPWPTYLPIFSGAQEASWDPSELTSLIDEWDAASGCVTDGACQQIYASNTALSLDQAGYKAGHYDWVAGGLVYTDSGAASHQTILDQYHGGTSSKRPLLLTVTDSGTKVTAYSLDVDGVGVSGATVVYVSADTWYAWSAWYIASTKTLYIKFGATTLYSKVHTGNIGTADTALKFGRGNFYSSGLRQQSCFFSQATWSEALHDAWHGDQSFYADAPASVTAPISGATYGEWWNCSEASGARVGALGRFNLAAVNAPGVAAGVAEGAAVNNSPVKSWTGKWNSTSLAQATIAKQPLWIASGQNSKPVVQFDGTDDYMTTSGEADRAQPNSYFLGAKHSGATSKYLFDGAGATKRNSLGSGNDAGTGRWQLYAGAVRLGAAADDNNFNVFSVLYNTTASSMRLNGVEDISSGNAGSHVMADIIVGSRSGGADGFVAGNIGTFIWQDALATADEITAAESYLNTKYAVY